MLEEKRGKKQEELHKVLLELASPSVGMLQENSRPLLTYIIRLSSIYDDDFRHQYSLFFDEVLKKFLKNRTEKTLKPFERISALSGNLFVTTEKTRFRKKLLNFTITFGLKYPDGSFYSAKRAD